MSKRSRDGDVIVARPGFHTVPNPLKRRLEWPNTPRKRQMLLMQHEAESFVEPDPLRMAEPTRKRDADFDIEIRHLHKRLRATIPTAEEAISFLVPHMKRLREVYMQSKSHNGLLLQHLQALKGAYYKTKGKNQELLKHVSEYRQEINGLRRQLALAKYRLAMTDTTSKAAMFQ